MTKKSILCILLCTAVIAALLVGVVAFEKKQAPTQVTEEPAPEPAKSAEPLPEEAPLPPIAPEVPAEAAPAESPAPEVTSDVQEEPPTENPAPAQSPAPEPSKAADTPQEELHCTISIACGTILNNPELCDPDKVELLPADGWFLQPVTAAFQAGESVFDVLQRVCEENRIHMEFSFTPLYNSAYIEGIANFYEFDVGPLSGWMYQVNGWFPNYGCSQYLLQDGDVICWVYTCDLGADVGGGFTE